jgi:hypothetical protein
MIMQKSYDFSKMEKNLASYAVCHTIKGCIHIITSALNLLQSTENSEKVNSFLIFFKTLFIYLFFAVLWFELRAYPLSHFTSPFFAKGFFPR